MAIDNPKAPIVPTDTTEHQLAHTVAGDLYQALTELGRRTVQDVLIDLIGDAWHIIDRSLEAATIHAAIGGDLLVALSNRGRNAGCRPTRFRRSSAAAALMLAYLNTRILVDFAAWAVDHQNRAPGRLRTDHGRRLQAIGGACLVTATETHALSSRYEALYTLQVLDTVSLPNRFLA